MADELAALRNPERQLADLSFIAARAAEIHPNRTAVIDRLNDRRVTYAELDTRINRTAQALCTAGVARGDLIAVMFNNELTIIELLLASGRIGAVICPVNVRLPANEVQAYLAPHHVRAIVSHVQLADRFSAVSAAIRLAWRPEPGESGASGTSRASLPAGWQDLDALRKATSADVPAAVTTLDDAFRMIPTGGTTGVSKGVLHSHGGTLFTVLSNVADFGIQRGWKTVLIAPTYHGAGMDWGLFPILWRAGTVILPSSASFSALEYLQLVREHQVEFALLVPAVIQPLHAAWDGEPLGSVRSLVSTSAPTAPGLRAKLAEMFPNAQLRAGSGISESLNMAVQSGDDFLERPYSVGEPSLDTRLRIVDEAGRRVPAGTRGEICLRGFNTALGYHHHNAAGAATWRTLADDPQGLQWCFTGDIGVQGEDGDVRIVDRSKDVILSGGETVPSVEIEQVYADHARLRESAVIGLPDEQWGEAITLVAVSKDATADEALLCAELFAFGRRHLAGYKVPKRIVFLDALPRSHFGKVLKRELRGGAFARIHVPQAVSSLPEDSAQAASA